MTLSLHSVVVTGPAQMLRNTLTWLDKAQVHASHNAMDSVDFLPMRLAPDMLSFDKQVLVVSEVAKLGVSRLVGVEAPKWEQVDGTLQDLCQRLQQTIAYLESFSPAQVDDSAVRDIVVAQRGKEALNFDRNGFVQRWVQPNFFFHSTTIYALLRHAGVSLGKADYLGIH